MYRDISDKSLQGFKEAFAKDGITYETDAEYREAASNLLGLFDVLIEIDTAEHKRKRQLEDNPKGFSMPSEGRNCSLCQRGVYDGDGWYDKWGFKCMNCQTAINKKNIPGSLCGDWDHKKYHTESSLSWKSGLHAQTIRKLIREDKIKVRQIPNGPKLILLKDNPNLELINKAD